MRIVLRIIFLSLLCMPVRGQQVKQYSFKHFSVSNGLLSNTVSAVIQDHEGYMWMATIDALQRYDGISFIAFKNQPGNPFSIPADHIISMFVDSKKNLWLIGDNSRVGIFDTKHFVFREVNMPAEKSAYYIPQSFLEMETGQLLIQKSDGNLLRYEASNNRFVSDTDVLPCPVKWTR
ncbi:MAG: two-component regulator propeller domain-containing protein, partial [Flavisolibacter sp.]